MMADRKSFNLIDLSIEEENLEQPSAVKNSIQTTSSIDPIFQTQNSVFNGIENCMPIYGKSTNSGESFENNPFDRAQKQVNYLDDPFEIVLQEISQNCIKPRHEVETGNLLLIDDDVLDEKILVKQPAFSNVVNSFHLEPSFGFSCASSFNSDLSLLQNDSSIMKISDNIISTDLINKENTEIPMAFEHPSDNIFNLSQISSNEMQETTVQSDKFSETIETPESNKSKNVKSAEQRKRLLKFSISNSSINSPLNRRTSRSSENSSPMTVVCKEAEILANKMSEIMIDSPESFEDSCDDLMSIEPKWVESEGDVDSDIEMMNIPILKEMNSPKNYDEKTNMKIENEKIPLDTTTINVMKKNSTNMDKDLEILRERVKLQRQECNNKESDLEILRERVKLQQQECSNFNQDPALLISNLKNIISECSSDTKKSEANSLLESLSSIFNVSEGKENKLELPPPPQPIIRQGTFDIDLKDKDENSIKADKILHEQFKNEKIEYLSPNNNNKSQKEQNIEPNTPETTPSDISNIMDQIGRLLGNQNVNVVQANLTTPGKGNPTYIVVMNTPIMSNKNQSILFNNEENDSEIVMNNATMRRRSQSLSIHDKSKLAVTKPHAIQINQNENKTQGRGGYVARRNSFSTPTQVNTPSLSANARRSMYNLNREPTQKPIPRKLLLETHHEQQSNALPVQTKPFATIRPEINTRKFKLKANECVVRSQGPLKATIPIRKVVPMIVTSSPIDDPNIKKGSNTSVLTTKSSNSYPIACSTPGNGYSPSRNSVKPKSRYSNLPVTPTSKPSSTFQNRRRTMSEMKSPRKRIDGKTSMGISKPAIKSLKLPPALSQAINQLTPKKMGSKPPTKTMEHNKENSKPSFG